MNTLSIDEVISKLSDSVTMLTKEGFELRHEVFLHEAPVTEEVTEE